MELGSCLNSLIPAEHKAKQVVLGLCRLKISALLPESPYHAGSDAALLQM